MVPPAADALRASRPEVFWTGVGFDT